MMNYIKEATVLLVLLLSIISCDNSNDLLNQYIQNGPIIYAAKVDSMKMQAGYGRLRVNVFPAEDVNRSHCILSWNITSGVKDSVKMNYVDENYDKLLGCYYTIIDVSSNNIQGNLLIEAQNTDDFGNKSLISNEGAFVYGKAYLSTLTNASLSFSPNVDKVYFEEKIGSVGNIISYQQNDGNFTEEVLVTDSSFPITDAKVGGIVRSKTRYLVTKTDIDTLESTEYLETVIKDESHIEKNINYKEIKALSVFNYAYDNKNRDYDTYGVDPITGIPNDGNYHNESMGPHTIFNGNRTTNAYYGYKFMKDNKLIHTFYSTYDLNVEVRLSQINLAPRSWTGYHYKNATPKRFRIWGTNDANQDRFKKFPEKWILIGEYVGPEPIDRNNLTPEESHYFINNNNFNILEDNINPSANPTKSFRYMRIELMESYDPSAKFYVINELELKGYISKYYYDLEGQ